MNKKTKMQIRLLRWYIKKDILDEKRNVVLKELDLHTCELRDLLTEFGLFPVIRVPFLEIERRKRRIKNGMA